MSNCFTEKRTVKLTQEQIEELQPFIDAMRDKKINPNGDMALVAQVFIEEDDSLSLHVIMVDSTADKEIQSARLRSVGRARS